MATLVEAHELITERSCKVNHDFTKDYKVVFLMEYDHGDARPRQQEVVDDPALPELLDTYDYPNDVDLTALLKDKVARPNDDGGYTWKVECKYTSKWDEDPFNNTDNPLDMPAIISITTRRFQRPVFEDLTRTAIRNSAECAFDPTPTVEDNIPVISVTKNVATLDPTLMKTYRNAVNDAAWLGFDEGECRIETFNVFQRYANGIIYQEVNLQILVKENYQAYVDSTSTQIDVEGHDLLVLDAGYEALVVDGLEYIQHKGVRPSKPWPLDGVGVAQPVGYDPATVSYRRFQIYPKEDFGALGFLL